MLTVLGLRVEVFFKNGYWKGGKVFSGWGVGGWGFGFRVSGFGFRVSGFGFRVSGVGFRVSGFGFWVSAFGFKRTRRFERRPISGGTRLG